METPTCRPLPFEMLQVIFKNMDHQELRACTQVCQHWRDASIDDYLWKPYFEKYFLWFNDRLMECNTYFDEFVYFKDFIPKRFCSVIDDFEYPTRICKYSNDGKYFFVIGDDAHFCLYKSNPLEFLHERTVKETLNWKLIHNASFSPNSDMILLNGEKMDGSGEVAVFRINTETETVHFLSRAQSNPVSFEACWFDNIHILVGEIHNFDFQSPLGSSISQLWLSSVEQLSTESVFVPLMRFLNKSGSVRLPLVADHVSSRFRRIVQLSEEAFREGATLRDKLNELALNAHFDENDVSELKEILDKEHECYICYFQHSIKHENTENTCKCVCHNDTQKMLIFVSGRLSNRVSFKVIDQKLITDALSSKRYEASEESTSEERDTLENIMKKFDQIDYHIEFMGRINNLYLSPNHRSLYVDMERLDSLNTHEIKVIDLEKMIQDPIGIHGRMTSPGRHFASVTDSLVASFAGEKVQVWSRQHRGSSIRTIQIDSKVNCVSLHPHNNNMVVALEQGIHIYEP